MAEESTFRGIIEFFVRLGVYDVILPFLLVFTIMFAILEKTKVLGTDKDEEGNPVPKRNLNSMVAFCMGFFVILSKELVSFINEALANVVLLVLISVCFLLLIGTFMKEKDTPVYLKGGWKIGFMVAMLIGVIMIFLHAIKTEDGTPWLTYGYNFVTDYWNTEWLASIIFVAIIVGFMFWITRAPKKSNKDDKKDNDDDDDD